MVFVTLVPMLAPRIIGMAVLTLRKLWDNFETALRQLRNNFETALRKLWTIGIDVLTGTFADTRPTMMDVEVDEDCTWTYSFLTQTTQRISYLNKNRDENTNHHAHNRIVQEVRVLKESWKKYDDMNLTTMRTPLEDFQFSSYTVHPQHFFLLKYFPLLSFCYYSSFCDQIFPLKKLLLCLELEVKSSGPF